MSDPAAERRIVYVLGPGRSGTSTVAGALCMSGFEVPGRAIRGNETNPVGFYEPRWVVDLHKRLLERAVVGTLDSEPTAYEIVQDTLGVRQRNVLRAWLEQRLDEQPRLVVKDPRGIWFKDLWSDVAAELDVPVGFLMMLRHPAEVSGSRQKYYSKTAAEQPLDDVTRVGGWLNVALTAERITRGSSRVFVRYADLLGDWRPVLQGISDQLDLVLDPSPHVRPHPVDGFIDPALRRVRVDWDDLSLPTQVREIGERVWLTLSELADTGERTSSLAELDVLRKEFSVFSEQTLALHKQTVKRLELRARRQGRADARRALAADSAPEQSETAPEQSETGDHRPGTRQAQGAASDRGTRTGRVLGRLGVKR